MRIARAARTVVFPARFMLIGAMNPCPCGFLGDAVAALPLRRAAGRALRVAPVGSAARSTRSDGAGRRRAGPRAAGRRSPANRLLARSAPASCRRAHQAAGARRPAQRATARARAALARRAGRRTPRSLMAKALARLSLSARGYDRVLRVVAHDRRLGARIDRDRRRISRKPCSIEAIASGHSSDALQLPLSSTIASAGGFSSAAPAVVKFRFTDIEF